MKKKTETKKVATAVTVAIEEKKQTDADKFWDEAHLLVDSLTTDIQTVENTETDDAQRTIIVKEMRGKLLKFAAGMKPYIDVMSKRIASVQEKLAKEFPTDQHRTMYLKDEFIQEIMTGIKTLQFLHEKLARVTGHTREERIDQHRVPGVSEEKALENFKRFEEMHIGSSDVYFGGHDVKELSDFFRKSTESWHEILQQYHFDSIMGQREFRIHTDEEAQEYLHSDKKLPDFCDKSMQLVLNQMMLGAATGDAEILKGVYKTDEFSIEWTVWFFTSPRQLKILFADRFRRYPVLSLSYKYTSKYQKCQVISERTNLSLAYICALVHASNDVTTFPLHPSKTD